MSVQADKRTYSIPRVFSLRDKIFAASRGYVGQEIVGPQLDGLLELFQRQLKHDIPRDVIRTSILDLIGVPLTVDSLYDTAWRLAGNLQRLQNFHAVPPWNRQAVPEYVPVQVVSVGKALRNNRMAVALELRILAGTPAPRILRNVWSAKFCAVLGRRLGFSKSCGCAKRKAR